MNHSIDVHLGANIDKYKAGMDAAKKMGSDSLGFIASIFDKIKTMFSGMWDSFKSMFSGIGDKFKSMFGSISDSASGAFSKISGYFSGFHSDADKANAKVAETDEKSAGLAKTIGITLVAAFVAATAVISAMVAKGLALDAMYAGISTSTNIAVSDISRFEGAAARSGMSVKELGDSMGKFHDAMVKAAKGDGSDEFTKLGVKVTDANGAMLKTGDVFIETSKKIAAMSNEADKYDAASKVAFGGKVQFLEDTAHAGTLVASVTNEQAEAATRLGKIWHEIGSSGPSMWSEIGGKMTNALMPAMTAVSITILESKNKIVGAFNDIFGGASIFDKLATKIQGWGTDASKWFDGVAKSATNMTTSIMQYIALKTGLGDPAALKPSTGGYVPAPVKLNNDKPETPVTDAQKAAGLQFDQMTKSLTDRTAVMKEQIKVGATLTEGQRALLQLDNDDLKLSPEKIAAGKAQATALDALEKQFKSQQDAKAAAAAASKKEEDSYASLISSIQSKIETDKLELAVGVDATESQKILAKLNAELTSGKLKLSAAHEASARSAIQELGVTEQQIKASKDFADAMKAINAAGDGSLKSLDDEIAKQKEHNAEIGKTKEQIELMRQAQAQAQSEDMAREAAAIDALLNQSDLQGVLIGKDRDLYAARLAYLDQEIGKRATLAGLHADGASAEAQAQMAADAAAASKHLAEMAIQDWRNAGADIADSLSSAFGTAGSAIGQMFKAFSDGQAEQMRAAKELAEAKAKLDTDPEKVAAINHAQELGAQAQLKSYGDMAAAAKGFFQENTTGYKLMEGAEKAFRLIELANQMESLYTHLFVTSAKAVATTAGQAVETTAVGAGEAERNALKVPGVFMSFMSALGPYGAAAAAVAIAAVLGGAFSGGSGVDVSKQRQDAQGAGTVLGDSSAKSDSISKSIDLTAANSSTQINYLSGLLTTLKGIQSDITSFTSELIQTTNLSGDSLSGSKGAAAQFGSSTVGVALTGGIIGLALDKLTNGFIGKITGSVLGSIFGGKQTVTDTGFTLGKTSLGSALANGVDGKSYADITTSGGWFSKDKNSEQTTSLGADANQQFTTIIKSLASSITQASGLLGVSGDDFTKQLNSFVIDIGNVSLKGLSGEDQEKAIEAVFSKLGDQMAQAAIPDLAKFQQVGEGYLETLVRVASDYAKVDASLQSVGLTFGSVGVASIAARENLVALAGGIDTFQSETADFATNFLTKAQQLAPVKAYVDQAMAALGYSGVNTREQFASIVQGLDLSSAAGEQTYATLMSLESAFASVTPAIVDATMSAQDIIDQRKDLQDKLDDLLMTSEQLRSKELATIDATNVALYNQVTAAQNAKDALDLQGQIYAATGNKAGAAAVLLLQHQAALAQTDPALRALTQQLWDVQAAATAAADAKTSAAGLITDAENAFTVLQNVTKTTTDALTKRIAAEQALSDAVKSTLASMTTSTTTLTDRAAAQAQIKAAVAAAQTGNMPTADSLKDALSTVSKDASDQFSSYADYLKDLYSTKNDLGNLGDLADSSLSVDQKQLDSLNDMLTAAQKQLDVLKGIDTTALTIAQALAGFQSSVAVAGANPINAATSAIGAAYQSSLGRAPDAAGLAYWQQAAANGNSLSDITKSISTSTEAQVGQLYQTLLGRPADGAGLAYYMGTGESVAQIKADIMASNEYKAHQHALGIPGFANGGDFAGGVRMVGEVGPEIETTGASRIHSTKSLVEALRSPSDNSAVLVAAVRALQDEVTKLREANSAENLAIAKGTQQAGEILDKWDATGQPEERQE